MSESDDKAVGVRAGADWDSRSRALYVSRGFVGCHIRGRYVALKSPRYRLYFSERNRINCSVYSLGRGWRIVVRQQASMPKGDTNVAFVRFALPSTGERWNWPVEGAGSIDAFVEILDRANIPWSIQEDAAGDRGKPS